MEAFLKEFALITVFNKLRGVASWYVFRVRGSLAARVWKYHETMDDETTPGPNPSAGSAAPAAC